LFDPHGVEVDVGQRGEQRVVDEIIHGGIRYADGASLVRDLRQPFHRVDQDVLKVAGDGVLAAGSLLGVAAGNGVDVLCLLALVTEHGELLNEIISENLGRRDGAVCGLRPAVGWGTPYPKGWRTLCRDRGCRLDQRQAAVGMMTGGMRPQM
jgi:hypothetical protein